MSKQSRFLSLILRHKPEEGNIILDENGWTSVDGVVTSLRNRFGEFSRADLEAIVRDNDKQRFSLVGDLIRANQGHSVEVDLNLAPSKPPVVLYHGTKVAFLEAILSEGLKRGSRHHVHLSPSVETAQKVADRRNGASVILEVRSLDMDQPFYESQNGVWLTDSVAPEFLSVMPSF